MEYLSIVEPSKVPFSCDTTHSCNSSLKLSQTLVICKVLWEKTFQKSLKEPKKPPAKHPCTSHTLQDWSCDWKSCRKLASLSIFVTLIKGVYQEGDDTSSSLSLLYPAAKKANHTLTIIFTSWCFTGQCIMLLRVPVGGHRFHLTSERRKQFTAVSLSPDRTKNLKLHI